MPQTMAYSCDYCGRQDGADGGGNCRGCGAPFMAHPAPQTQHITWIYTAPANWSADAIKGFQRELEKAMRRGGRHRIALFPN